MGAGGATIHFAGARSVFLSVMSDPNLDSLLFLAGTFAILADLYHPTLILTVVGAVAIALALLGLGVFGAPIVSIVLMRSEEHTSELQSRPHLVCRLLLEKKKKTTLNKSLAIIFFSLVS